MMKVLLIFLAIAFDSLEENHYRFMSTGATENTLYMHSFSIVVTKQCPAIMLALDHHYHYYHYFISIN